MHRIAGTAMHRGVLHHIAGAARLQNPSQRRGEHIGRQHSKVVPVFRSSPAPA